MYRQHASKWDEGVIAWDGLLLNGWSPILHSLGTRESLRRCIAIKFARGAADDGSEEEDRAWTQAGLGTRRQGTGLEVRYAAKKTGRSASAVKKAVKKVGNSRKRVEKRLGR